MGQRQGFGLRGVMTAAVLLAGGLPAAGAAWLFPAIDRFYDIGANWDTGTAPGAGEVAEFLGANTGIVQWDGITGDTTSASLLVDTADITLINLTGVSPVMTHTTVGDTFVTNNGVLNLGLSATQPMILDVGGQLRVADGGQFSARFGSTVDAGLLSIGTLGGSDAVATFDGAGSTIAVADTTYLGQNGSAGTLSFINGSTGNTLAGYVGLASSSFDNSAGVLNVTGGSTVSTGRIETGHGGDTGQSATILVDGAGSQIDQTGSSTFTLGAGSNSTGLLTVSNGGLFRTGTGAATINTTGTLNINSGGVFVGRDVQLAGTANVNGGLLYADHLQLNGGALNTDSGSVVSVNTMTGFGDSIVLNGLVSFGEPTGAATASHTVSSGQTFTVGQALNIGINRQATFMIADGAVTARHVTLGVVAGVGGSAIHVTNGGALTVHEDVYVGGSAFGAGAGGTLSIAGPGSEVSIGDTLRIFSTGTVDLSNSATLRAHTIDATGGGTLQATTGSTIHFNHLVGFANTIAFDGNIRTGIDQGDGVSSHTVGAGQEFFVGGYMKVGTESGLTSAQFDVNGGQLDVNEYLDVASPYNGNGGDATFRVLNGGTVNSGFATTSDYGSVSTGDAAATLVIDGAGSRWNVGDARLIRGTMTIANGGTYQANGSFLVGSVGAVHLNAGGTLRAGTVTHTTSGGAFNFNGGTLGVEAFNGNLTNSGGTLLVGDDLPISNRGGGGEAFFGQTTINGDYTQQAGGTLVLDFYSDDLPGDSHDLLTVTGHLMLAGTLIFQDNFGHSYSHGDRFNVLDWGTLSGTFDQIVLDLSSFSALNTQDLYTTGEIRVERIGDLNTDGFVGVEDLDLLLAHWGQTTHQYNFAGGDLSGDGLAGQADLDIIIANWGNGTPPGNVPEPGTAAMLGLMLLAGRRRRRYA